jgi:hypothetical protein
VRFTPQNGARLGVSIKTHKASVAEVAADVVASLPESFGGLTVGGGLYLQNNKLESLPESFESLTLDGDLSLNNNDLGSTWDRSRSRLGSRW